MLNKMLNRILYFLLLPFSMLYKAAVLLRNKLYDIGLFKSCRFDISVVSVGNITVGGTGKTPHTEYLISLLYNDFHVAVLSRGYKRRSKGFRYVEINDPATETGDEPLQIKRKYSSGVVVAVDSDRVRGILRLQTDYPDLDLILLDDAFQHRRINPSLNIVLIDYNRPVWNDALLPSGRLRDCLSSLCRADIIVITKCPEQISQEEKQKYASNLKRYNKPVYFSRFDVGEAYSLSGLGKLPDDPSKLLALSGISNPSVFFGQLAKQYPKAIIEKIAFSDHHYFSEKDIHNILRQAGSHAIVTTEKDSMRLISYFCNAEFQLPDNIYCVPIKVIIDDSNSFNINVINHVRKNKENGRLH
ncbi:MAG: tetraacyldisaccharide 4'-kinase [Prevotellaceae bacterium]|jgi:tetraacyldisaccharide 4'-kinase|nr:tetraacyldisaccharide 4'-kinase [Prevotellaceae bacterium]